MSALLHLRIVGAMLVLLGLSHVFFNRYFGWDRELAGISLLTRRVFFVHLFFIALGVGLSGVVTFACARELLQRSALNRTLLSVAVAFWFCRLLAQFVGYDAAIWKGDRLRTSMHVVFSLLWCYVTAVYAYALHLVWTGGR